METTPSRGLRRRGLGLLLLSVFAGTVVLLSCYPGGPTNVGELDLVVTRYDQDADLGTRATYALFDSVVHLGDPEDPDYIELSREFDEQILNEVASQMEALNYTRVDSIIEGQEPSFAVQVSAVGPNNWAAYLYYPWYPGWGYPGWGWWYPWYPPGATVVNYKTGTIYIDMGDLDNRDASDPDSVIVPVVWNATMNGLLGTVDAETSARLDRSIRQAYDQSKYLKVTQ